MKRLLTISVLFLLGHFSILMGNDLRIMESLSMYSKILGQEVKYSICLPEEYFKGNHNYPVVYLLHGLGDDETAWLEYGRISQIADKAVKKGEIIPMIFIMPQGFRSYYVNDFAGNFKYQDMFIKELIPYIDSHYRTIADNKHRAVMGYSMGGFGALILPLKNPEVFGVSVPLSISIRTDKQYMEEEAPEWDKQWGSIFGGVGKTGAERITDYYKQNCPSHIFSQNDLSKLKDLKIFIDNGDDEHTLCRSNEELHILLRDRNFPHEFRVRDGGHNFQYWCSALPNALNFISDAFNSRIYRGDILPEPSAVKIANGQFRYITVGQEKLIAFLPAQYDYSTRLYPVIYIAGNFTEVQQKELSETINSILESSDSGPLLVVFLSKNALNNVKFTLKELEENLRIRKGYRFRALAGYKDEGFKVLKTAINDEQFSICMLMDASLLKDSVSELFASLNRDSVKHTLFFIDAPDKGRFYNGNGNAHMILRDKDIDHEYRVREGNGGFEWFLRGLPEIIDVTSKKIHR